MEDSDSQENGRTGGAQPLSLKSPGGLDDPSGSPVGSPLAAKSFSRGQRAQKLEKTKLEVMGEAAALGATGTKFDASPFFHC